MIWNEDWQCFYCQEWNNYLKTECYWCRKPKKVEEEEQEQARVPIYTPSPFSDKDYEMKTVDEAYGYIFYFKEGEPKMLGKEAHVHIRGRGHGREIQFYLSPFRLKKKQPSNFPRNEESKLKEHAFKNRQKYLDDWEEVKNK